MLLKFGEYMVKVSALEDCELCRVNIGPIWIIRYIDVH